MSEAVTELLAQLVDVTQPPPAADDPEALLTAFDAMVATRAALLAQLEARMPVPLSDAARALGEELRARDHAWLAALGLARQTVADRLGAVRRAQRRS